MGEVNVKEEGLDGPDEACDPALGKLLALWMSMVCDNEPPLRQTLDPFTLKPWLGHISIFEALDGNDFVIRLDGSAIVELTGENWTAHRASDVDRKYGSHLVDHLSDVTQTKRPVFHRMMIFQKRHFLASRLLLPIRKSMDGPANQVFLALYMDIVQPEE
ncbi:PAS domain-containing protein [Hwanghaeella grinnelliae]|uniref:PAS domain-containing protein n=1 Tax=Hwanghaeella grinnelliae TaxID=2500179 RepID=A0A437QL14_9PROT|nr:PAS domain-containing protein [Hwanghaeella grinnelliae]RVU35198.1 PAS domain-containing protein [Hwanghaeella grinnelliae]